MIDQSKHEEITTRINRDWEQSEYSRNNGSRDLTFARRTQWDDELDENVSTEYRGQFDIVKPERRRILATLMKNEFNNRYRPKSEDDEKLAEVLQNLYRATVRTPDAKQAAEVAISEAIDCGVGAWRLEVVDEDERDPLNTNKKIVRSVIHEANSKVAWDANSKKIDKSDAKTCTVVFSLAKDAWKELMEEHGLSDSEADFPLPDYMSNSSLSWAGGENHTIAEHYAIKDTKQKMHIMSDGDRVIALTTGELRNKGDALKSQGFERQTTKRVVNTSVWKTVLTGAHILDNYKISGRHIPIVPLYGEWSINDGIELWEGLVRALRDPQQMKNTSLSYIFDLLAKGPIEKDIYAQEQIDGYEEMYETQNKHDHPYYLQNLYDANGNQLPPGPLGTKGGPQVPPAAQYLLNAAEQSVSQSVGGGVTPEQMINPQVTDDQLEIIAAHMDVQSQLFKEHLEYSYRREGQICASIWSEIIDNERDLNVITQDGEESKVRVNEFISDIGSLSSSIEIDMSRADMDVFTDVGISQSTERGQVRTEMMQLLDKPISPEDQRLAQLTYIMNLEGSAYGVMRKNARKQMVMAGYVEGDELTEEEQQMLQEAQQQPQEPQGDPAMMLAAQAEKTKADAQVMGEQTDAKKAEIDMFNAETNRMKVQLEAERLGIKLQESQADIQNKNANTAKTMREVRSKDVDDMVKVKDSHLRQQESLSSLLAQPINA